VAVVLDSDAVIGFLDRDDALHRAAHSIVRDLAQSHPLLVSAVTYAEVLTGARLGRNDEERVLGFFTDLISEVVPVDIDVAALAADIRARARAVRMPDALILATAEIRPDVDCLLTGDAELRRVPQLNTEVRLLS
jgi:predicted nucleic acid-binding protein